MGFISKEEFAGLCVGSNAAREHGLFQMGFASLNPSFYAAQQTSSRQMKIEHPEK